jgi:hypothetical protein
MDTQKMNLKRIKKDQLGKLIKKYRCDSFVIIVIFLKSNKNYLRIDHISLLDLFILSRHFDIIIIG